MTTVNFWIINAFTDRIAGGNPAAVIVLEDWPADQALGAMAKALAQPTTGFLLGNALRYFLPTGVEVDFVGHATLAVGHLLLERRDKALVTHRGGEVVLERDTNGRTAFSMSPLQLVPDPADGLLPALGGGDAWTGANDLQFFAVYDDVASVKALRPDMSALLGVARDSVVATAVGNDCDFVSRAFAPREGLPEDPVCGIAHVALAPFWARQLGKTDLVARQLSERAGTLYCKVFDGGVRLAGDCRKWCEGRIDFS